MAVPRPSLTAVLAVRYHCMSGGAIAVLASAAERWLHDVRLLMGCGFRS